MIKVRKNEKQYGIVEGFFSAPLPMWSWKDRYAILESMGSSKLLNTYLYCPKDDPQVSKYWYKRYTKRQEIAFNKFIIACRRSGVEFVYGLNPEMSNGKLTQKKFESYIEKIANKLAQLARLGVNRFCILYDDIPYAYNALLKTASDESREYAQLQSKVINTLLSRFPEKKFIFCSSEYFFQKDNVYLQELRKILSPRVDLIWTGKSVFTRRVNKSMIIKAKQLVGDRKLILWNNYPVNDPMAQGIVNLGGFNPPETACIDLLNGILINPLREAAASTPNLQTFSEYLKAPTEYNRTRSYLKFISSRCELDISEARPIVECSNVSAIDTKLKYYFKALKQRKEKKILESISTTLENWDRNNASKNSLNTIRSDLEFMMRLVETKQITEEQFKIFDVFPIPIDYVYVDRFLFILLTRFTLLQNAITRCKLIECIDDVRSSREVQYKTGFAELDQLISIYNEYLGMNRKLLPKRFLTKYQNLMENAVSSERKGFIECIKALPRTKVPMIVSLRKNINQYSIRMVVRELSRLTPSST